MTYENTKSANSSFVRLGNFIRSRWQIRIILSIVWLIGLYILGLFFACAPGPCQGELVIKSLVLRFVVGLAAYALGYFRWFRYITYVTIIIGCILFVVDPI